MKLRLLIALAAAALLTWSILQIVGDGAPPAPVLSGDVADEPASVPPAGQDGGAAREALAQAPARTWTLAGRVALPAGTPEDEQLLLRVRAGAHDAEIPVADDGRFLLELPVDAHEAQLELAARYLFLEAPLRVEEPRDGARAEVLLEPRLGALLRVQIRAPVGFAPAALDDAKVSVRGSRDPAAPARMAGPLGAGVVELGGLDPDELYTATVECAPFVRERRDALRLYAGERTELEVALRQGVRVAGRVLDAQGEPVAGAEVLVERPNPAPAGLVAWIADGEAMTDADGAFALAGLHAGTLRVKARGAGEERAELELGELADGEARANLVLRFAAGEHVAGRVRWPEGEPARGAGVRVLAMRDPWSRGVEAETDADGRFRCGGLPGGPYAVLAWCRRADAAGPPAVWRARRDDVPAGRTDVELTLSVGGRIAGRVVDDLGAPVEVARIVARPLDDALGVRSKGQREEDADGGGFVLEGVEDGPWDLRAEADGHAPSPWTRVRMPEGAAELTLVVPRLAGLAGLVSAPDGSALAAAAVTLRTPADAPFATPRSARSDASGSFLFEDVPPGAVTLVAASEGLLASAPVEVQLAPGVLRDGLELVLRVGARLEGELDPSVEDFARRQVMAMPADSFTSVTTLCDAEGRFLFEGLAPGRWSVAFDWRTAGGGGGDWISGFQRRAEELVELFEGETTHVVLGAPHPDAVRVSGRVLRRGEPQPGYLVYAHPPENDTAKPAAMPLNIARTDDDGGYALMLPAPGRYRFSVGPDTTFQVRFFEDVPEGPEVALDFELPGCTLSGTVLRGDGAPAASHPLLLVCADAPASSRAFGDVHASGTDADGRFHYEDLQPGEYVLRLGGWTPDTHGLGVELVDGLVLVDGEETEELLIELDEAAVVEGGVLGPDGRPAPGVEVNVHDASGRELYIWRPVQTDYTGSFRFPNVGAGERVVVAADGQGRRAEAELSLAPGELARITLQLE